MSWQWQRSFILCGSLIVILGCGGGGGVTSATQLQPPQPAVLNIYAAGKDSPNGTLVRVWKNGVPYLTLPSNSGGVTSMAVAGTDVYISTVLMTYPNNQPTYTYTVWKNGNAITSIAPSGSEVDALAVSGN